MWYRTVTGFNRNKSSCGQDPSPGVYILSVRLLQRAFLWYHGQLVSASAVDPERSGATSDRHQATQPHLTSSVMFALVASEATGRLQTGYIGIQVAARRNPFVPRRWLRAHRWLPTPLSTLGRRQRSLFRELILASETGVFRWRDRKYGDCSALTTFSL